jgi:hypothetical protein
MIHYEKIGLAKIKREYISATHPYFLAALRETLETP